MRGQGECRPAEMDGKTNFFPNLSVAIMRRESPAEDHHFCGRF